MCAGTFLSPPSVGSPILELILPSETAPPAHLTVFSSVISRTFGSVVRMVRSSGGGVWGPQLLYRTLSSAVIMRTETGPDFAPDGGVLAPCVLANDFALLFVLNLLRAMW